MENETIKLEIGGAETGDLYDDIVSLEVELDDELAGMARLMLAMPQDDDGTWKYVDDPRFIVGQSLVLTVTVGGETDKLFTGSVTHLKPDFGGDLDECRLEIWAMDRSVSMDRDDVIAAWPNYKDSDIAAQVFQTHGLTPKVDDTDVVHDEEVSTIIQRETDIRFLKRLAARNGYECYVEGKTGHFRKPDLTAPPQPVLAVQFGDDTNVFKFAVTVDGLAPADIAMSQLDRISKEAHRVVVSSPAQRALGKTAAGHYVGGGLAGLIEIGQTVTTGAPEMTRLCQGVYDKSEWFVVGEGEVAANQYGHILRPRRTVTIKGVGETYSGLWYVTHVTHAFTPNGYTQQFRVKRNALMLTGTENFAGQGLSLPGVPL
ncbi:MAG: phage late control D family protein [Candidatus Sericytochromatia bacterium]